MDHLSGAAAHAATLAKKGANPMSEVHESRSGLPLILAAEDDPTSQILLKEALQDAGMPCELEFVNDGESLVLRLRELVGPRHDDRVVPVLVLLDLNMPGRGGRQALVDIRRDATMRPMPIVVFSTSSAERDIDFCYREGANSYVVKPLDYNSLLEAIGDLCKFWLRTAVTPRMACAT